MNPYRRQAVRGKANTMRSKFRNIGLILVGVVAGILISLNLQAIADRDTPQPLPVEELRAFTDVFGAIKQNYVEPVDDKKLIAGAINGMVSDLDPHSAYLDKDAYRELQVSTQGQFGGLGIEVGMEDGFVKVVSPIEDTPAFHAGIKPGDLIVKIDQTLVKGMTLNDAVKRMRGKPNTKITLTISRKGETQPIVVTLTRAIIHVRSVKSKMIAARLRLDPRVAVPGSHRGKPRQGAAEDVPPGRAQRPGARPAQRPRRAALRRGGGVVHLPAGRRPGRFDRRPHRRREEAVSRHPRRPARRGRRLPQDRCRRRSRPCRWWCW